MPALSPKTKHYYRERVRSLLVQNPQISGDGIRRRLEQDGLTVDRHYINKLVDEIHTERIKRADTWTPWRSRRSRTPWARWYASAGR
jgi:hypothetical protein